MKPEQLEIARLKREVIKLKAERDILKKPRPTSRRNRREVRFHREAPEDLACGMVVRGARCLAGLAAQGIDFALALSAPVRTQQCGTAFIALPMALGAVSKSIGFQRLF